jgi:uncharacterized protein (DUF1778 family)
MLARLRLPVALNPFGIEDSRLKVGNRAVLQNAPQTASLPSSRFLMSRTVKRKEHPLSMRLPEADLAIVDRAASLRGRSRTDFVRDAAVRAAEDVLMDTMPIRMSPAGFKAFIAALCGPATAVPEMIELFRRPAPWETKAFSSKVDTGSREEKTSKHRGGSKAGS